MVLHINELAAARAGADLKEARAGGGRLRRECGAERRSTARQPRHPPTGAGGASGAGRRAPGSESRAGRAPSPFPAPAPRPSGQHETPIGRAAPAAPGAVCRTRGR